MNPPDQYVESRLQVKMNPPDQYVESRLQVKGFMCLVRRSIGPNDNLPHLTLTLSPRAARLNLTPTLSRPPAHLGPMLLRTNAPSDHSMPPQVKMNSPDLARDYIKQEPEDISIKHEPEDVSIKQEAEDISIKQESEDISIKQEAEDHPQLKMRQTVKRVLHGVSSNGEGEKVRRQRSTRSSVSSTIKQEEVNHEDQTSLPSTIKQEVNQEDHTHSGPYMVIYAEHNYTRSPGMAQTPSLDMPDTKDILHMVVCKEEVSPEQERSSRRNQNLHILKTNRRNYFKDQKNHLNLTLKSKKTVVIGRRPVKTMMTNGVTRVSVTHRSDCKNCRRYGPDWLCGHNRLKQCE